MSADHVKRLRTAARVLRSTGHHTHELACYEAADALASLQADRASVVEETADDTTLDRVAAAIEAAGCPGREGPFGLYDYSHGVSHPVHKPHCVRDLRDPQSSQFGAFILCTDDKEEARSLYERLTKHHTAQAAIRALADAGGPTQANLDDGPNNQTSAPEFGLAAGPVKREGWQPIESAPPGEHLLFFPANEGRNRMGAMTKVDRHPVYYPRKPTHWMRLPALPTEEA